MESKAVRCGRLPLKTDRQDLWPILGLVALVVFLFLDIIFRGRVLFQRDITSFNYPWLTAFSDAVRSGAFPLWEPRLNSGMPFLAHPNIGALYPVTWLAVLVSVQNQVKLAVIGHLLWAGIGAYALGRSVRLSARAAFVAAALWLCSGPLLSLGNLTNHLAGASWLPWSLYTARIALQSRTAFCAALWGVTIALPLLAGSPEMAFVAAFLGAGIAFVRIEWRRIASVENLAILRSAVVAAFFAVVLAAVQWLPTLELTGRAWRGQMSLHERTFWSVHPALMAQLALPVRLDRLPVAPEPKAALLDSREGFLLSTYCGLPAVLLFCAAFLTLGQTRTRWFAILVVGFWLFALGRHSPFYQLMAVVIPPLRLFRYPVKALVPAALMWSLLCGIGFEAWMRLLEKQRWRSLLIVSIPALLLTTAAVGLGMFFQMGAPGLVPHWLTNVRPPAIPIIERLHAAAWQLHFSAGMTILLLLLAWCLARRGHAGPRIAWLLLAAVPLGELAVTNRSINATAPREPFENRPPVLDSLPAPRSTRLYVVDYPDDRRHMLAEEPGHPALNPKQEEWIGAAADRSYLRHEIGRTFGFGNSFQPDATGMDTLHQRHMAALVFLTQDYSDFTRLLQMSAVDFVVARHDLEHSGLVLSARVPGYFPQAIRLYRVPDSLPKVFLAPGSRKAQGQDEMAMLLDPAFDIKREVLVADGPVTPPSSDFRSQGRIVRTGNNRTIVEATLNHPGWLVFVETFDPNWRVTVDGKTRKFVRANVIFRALHLPAGHHRIEAEYRPVSVSIGASISGCGLLLMLVMILRARRQRRVMMLPEGPVSAC